MKSKYLIRGMLVLMSIMQSTPAAKNDSTSHLKIPVAAVCVEGENPISTNFITDSGDPAFLTKQDSGSYVQKTFAKLRGQRASLLSTHKKPQGAYTASYEFETHKQLKGVLWVFEQGREWSSPFEWRIDNGEWHEVATTLRMQKKTTLAENGPCFAWSRIGLLGTLTPGKHSFEVRVTKPRNDGYFILSQDCFVILPLIAGNGEERPFMSDVEEPTGNSIYLWEEGLEPGSDVQDGFRPWIEPYLLKTENVRGAVLICPGGAYVGLAPHEGGPVAQRFNKAGFHAFVLHYRVSPHKFPAQLLDVAHAIRVIRSRWAEWKVDKNKIAVCGFSAGGHLSALIGTQFDRVPSVEKDTLQAVSCRPDAIILGYPVISTSSAYGAAGVIIRLVGQNAPKELADRVSLEYQVTDKTPPAFLWHCSDDGVDMRHSLAFATALKEKGVPVELHIYQEGGHGIGVAAFHPRVKTWTDLCSSWLTTLWAPATRKSVE